jgi:sterol desaturase/sphingolipid hydroxylase (fatty acid hydroxylase superfamily)
MKTISIMFFALIWTYVHVQLSHSGYYIPKIPEFINPVEYGAHRQYYSCNYAVITTLIDQITETYFSDHEILLQESIRSSYE